MENITFEQLPAKVGELCTRFDRIEGMLARILEGDAKDRADDKLLTAKDVKELFNISAPTLIAWRKEGKIIGHRIGTRVYYKQIELMAALKPTKAV
jgi:hypothetical protein